MPKIEIKISKPLVRSIHLQTLIFTILYYAVSKFIFVRSIANKNIFISFLPPFVFGLITTFIFLYFFSHEDFFHFIKGLEKKEAKTERKLLKKYHHHGKILATFIVAVLGGDILLALTIRLLLNKFAYKYLILIISVFISTLVGVGIAKGIFSFIR
jgi:hypothetical protein